MVAATTRFATPAEIAAWDEHVTGNPGGGNMLQSASYAATKQLGGAWRARYLVHEFQGESAAENYRSYNLVLEKQVPLLGRFWYMIKGPALADPAHIAAFCEANRRFVAVKRLRVFTIKIEPDILLNDNNRQLFSAAGLVKSVNLQPNDHTAILPINTTDEEELLKTLGSRSRNAIRRAAREGCRVERVGASDENMRTMYSLMQNVGGQKQLIRPFEYYQKFWSEFAEKDQSRFYFAFTDNKPVVAAFVVRYGKKGTYKDGGSLSEGRQYGDANLVQWRAITELVRDFGITEYDFCGTPPSEKIKDKTHPHYGMGLFKTAFVKQITDYIGAYEQVISPLKTRLWNAAFERLLRQLWVRKTGQNFY